MTNLTSRNSILFDSPATYQIVVQGRLDPAWSDRLEGMAIRQSVQDSGPSVTRLEGTLNDQAALVGVLNSLYEMHLALLSVLRVDTGQT